MRGRRRAVPDSDPSCYDYWRPGFVRGGSGCRGSVVAKKRPKKSSAELDDAARKAMREAGWTVVEKCSGVENCVSIVSMRGKQGSILLEYSCNPTVARAIIAKAYMDEFGEDPEEIAETVEDDEEDEED